MQMDWSIKEIDKRNPKHCLYIAFMTAATYFAGGILSTGESYSAAWPNSKLLCSATEADSEWKDASPGFGRFHLTA